MGGGSSCRGGTGRGTCAACTACKKHAENKIFQNKDAADTFRAHKGCRCEIIAGEVLDTNVADAVFAKGEVADKRDPETGGLVKPGSGVTVPVMAATLPVIAVGGGALGYYLMRRHDRERCSRRGRAGRLALTGCCGVQLRQVSVARRNSSDRNQACAVASGS